jgi:hypothetical protein
MRDCACEREARVSERSFCSLSLPRVSNSSESNSIERKIVDFYLGAHSRLTIPTQYKTKQDCPKRKPLAWVTFTGYLVLSSRLRGF